MMQKIVINPAWKLLFVVLMPVVIAACNNDSLNVVPGDPLVDANGLKESEFLTDDSFAPVVNFISLYDICGRNSRGANCNPQVRQIVSSTSTQKAVSTPARVLIVMDKPVYIDEASQVDILIENGDFFQATGALQPMILVSTDPLKFQEADLTNAVSLTDNKYQYFTTVAEQGDIYPRADGAVKVTLSAGVVYDINANNKKVYNKIGSGTFMYDTSRPAPEIKVLSIKGKEIQKISASAIDFGRLQLEIDWGSDETVINALANITEDFADPKKLIISCTGCASPMVFETREFNSKKSTTTKYYVTIIEDVSTDEVLTDLQNGAILSFRIVDGLVEDAAKNISKASNEASITVDASQPKINDVQLSLQGVEILDSGARVLNIGDSIRYTLTLSEAVSLVKTDDLVLQLFLGSAVALKAKINFSGSRQDAETGGIGEVWQLEYIIQEEKGDNLIGLTTSDFLGVGDSATTPPWLSDISQKYNIVPKNNTIFDAVGNPLDTTGLQDRLFPGGGIYQNLHIDAKRPRLVSNETTLLSYIKRLSGDTSVDVDIVPNGGTLAVAVSFSEAITDEDGVALDFNNASTWADTTLLVNFYNDSVGSSLAHSKQLTYSDSLTSFAHSDAYFSAFSDNLRTIVYSVTVDETFAATQSLQIATLEGLPGGIEPISLQDYADNLFSPVQARTNGFSINTDPLGLRIDGGPFSIASIYPMYKNDAGAIVAVPEAVEPRGQKYKQGDYFYAGVQLTRKVSGSSALNTNPPKLKLKIQTAESTEVELESSSVRFGFTSAGDIKNLLVFEFDLSSDDFEDANGVEVISLSDTNNDLKDSNATSLVYKSPADSTLLIDKALVRGSGEKAVMSQVWLDNKAPLCDSAYTTDKASGASPGSYYTINQNKPLYLAVQCDQAVIFNEPVDSSPDSSATAVNAASTDRPFIYGKFGADELGVIFNYSGLAQAGKRIVYTLPIELGYKAGTGANAKLRVGEFGNLSITKFYNKDTDTAGDFDFFADAIGNIADLSIGSSYFVENNLFAPGATGSTTGTAITVNTSPVPVKVAYSVDANIYKNSNNIAFLPGGDASRDDGKNTLTVKVDYGYFDVTGDVQSRVLTLGDTEDPSIDISYVNSGLAGGAKLDRQAFLSSPGSSDSLLFRMSVDYGLRTALSNQLLKAIQPNQLFNFASSAGLPYTQDRVSVYHENGSFKEDVTVDTPIGTQFLGTTVGLDSIPSIKISNSRPVLAIRDGVDVIPFEVWVASSTNLGSLAALSNASRKNSDTLYFGDIFFALVFDVAMDEESFAGTILNVDVSADSAKRIASLDMEWVSRQYITDNFVTENVVSNKKVFYKFVYGDSKYTGKGYSIAKTDLLRLDDGSSTELGTQRDIYGNYVDLATFATTLDNSDDFEVQIEARADIAKVTFSQEFYKLNDTIELVVETKGRLEDSLASGKVLAILANITRDEKAPNSGEEAVFLVQQGAAVEIAPSGTDEGGTRLTFTYVLDDQSTDQFNDDYTGDADKGISFSGAVRMCDSVAAGVENCELYETQVLDASSPGKAIRTAGLGIAEVSGVSTLAGVNSLSPYIQLSSDKVTGTDQIVIRKALAGETTLRLVTPTTRFTTGDSLVFDVPVSLQHIKKFDTKSTQNSLNDSRSGDAPKFQFYVFDIVKNQDVPREATYQEIVDNRNIRFSYTIQNGDYAGTPGAENTIVILNGLDVTMDKLASFDMAKLVSSGTSNSYIARLTDSEYGNPVSSNIYNATKAVRTGRLTDLSADIKIDTRTSITGFSAVTPEGSYKQGNVIEFAVAMSVDIDTNNVSSSPEPEFIVSISDNTTDIKQARAKYSRIDSTNAKRLIFSFAVPEGASGTASITDFSADGDNAFIRTSGVNINENLGSNTALTGLVFDTLQPEITSATRLSTEGVYSAVEGTGRNTARIALGLNKKVAIKGISATIKPSISIELDTKSGLTKTYNFALEDDKDTEMVRRLVFELKAATDLSDDIQDYSGIDVSATTINLPAGVSIKDSASNDLNLTLDLSTRADNPGFNAVAAIEGLNLSFDTSAPKIVKVIETKGGVGRTAPADYSADSEITFRVTFDETVDFANSIGGHYYMDVSFDHSIITATADLVTSGNSGKKEYDFVLETGNGYVDMNGLSLRDFIVTAAGTIQDGAANDLSTDITDASADLSNIRVDAEYPHAITPRVPIGTYSADNTLDARLTFNEPVFVTGTPTVDVELDTQKRTFTYSKKQGNSELVFTYVISQASDSDTNNATIKSPVNLASSSIVDVFGNAAQNKFTEVKSTNVNVRPNQGAVVSLVEAYVVTVGSSSPTLISPTGSVTSYGNGHKFYMVLTYSAEIESVVGVPSLTFNTGSGQTLSFDYTNDLLLDSDNTKLTFALASLPIDIDSPQGIETTGSIVLPSGAKISVAATTADPSLSVSGRFNNDLDKNGFLETVIIDNKQPEFSDVSADSGNFRAGKVIGFKVTLDESVDVSNSPTLKLTVGEDSKPIDCVNCASLTDSARARVLRFNYTVGVGEDAASGVVVDELSFPTGSSLSDVAGNSATTALEINRVLSDTIVDTTKPSVVAILSEVIDDTEPKTGSVTSGSITNDKKHQMLWRYRGDIGDSLHLYVVYKDRSDLTIKRHSALVTTKTQDSGIVSIYHPSLREGSYGIKIKITDIAGNEADDFSAVFAVTIDRTSPNAVVLTVVDNDGSNTQTVTKDIEGTTSVDSNTLLMQIALDTTVEEGFKIVVRNNGVPIAGASTLVTSGDSSSGEVRLTIADLTREETYEFSAVAEDFAGNQSSSSNVISIRVLNPPEVRSVANGGSIDHIDEDGDNHYSKDDKIQIFFNQEVKASALTISMLSLSGGKDFGSSPSINPYPSSNAASTEYRITLGDATTVVQGTNIIVDKDGVKSSLGDVPASDDPVFLLPDVTPPEELKVGSASIATAAVIDSGLGSAGSHGSEDQINLRLTEGISVTGIKASSVSVSSSSSSSSSPNFGSGYEAFVVGDTGSGYAPTIQIRLGDSPSLTSGDIITVAKADVRDDADNTPDNDLKYTLLDINLASVKDVSIESGLYGAGDSVPVTVTFSKDVAVSLGGSSITLKLNIGGSEVEARYDDSLSSEDKMIFVYIASGVVDADGVEVVANSITHGSLAAITSGGLDAELSFSKSLFPSVTVNAPFEFSKVTDIWFDATDIDADGDKTDQTVGDAVTHLYDKSGKDNHIYAGTRNGPTVALNSLNNNNLTLFFDTSERSTLRTSKNPGLGTSGYSYFVSLTSPNKNTGDYNYIFGTRHYDDGVAFLLNGKDPKYHLNSLNSGSDGLNKYGSIDIGNYVTTASVFISDSVSPGLYRVFSQGGETDIALGNVTKLIAGRVVAMGNLPGHNAHQARSFVNEVFYFNRSLTLAEKAITENYLGSKWKSAETTRNYYNGDDDAQGNYDHDVTGILKLAAVTVTTDSISAILPASNVAAARTGALLIANSASGGFLKDAGDRVFAGNKGGGATTENLPAGAGASSTVRSNKVWYLDIADKTNPGGNIDIALTPSLMDFDWTTDANAYELLWRSGEDGDFIKIASATDATNDTVRFSNIAVNTNVNNAVIADTGNVIKNGYITLGMADQAPPSLRYAEITDEQEITLTFDESIAEPEMGTFGFSIATTTFNSVENQQVSPRASHKVVLDTRMPVGVTEFETVTVSYTGPGSGTGPTGGIQDLVSNQLTTLPDIVVGTSGADTIVLAGASIVIADASNDTITASAGADVFDYNFITDGNDTINDFAVNADKIDLSDLLQYSNGQDISKFVRVVFTNDSVSVNLALSGTASQSSIVASYVAGNANDGDTGGMAHTDGVSTTEWWEVDLGSVKTIDSIKIWNRGNCCKDRIGNMYVMVSNTAFPDDLAESRANANFSHQLFKTETGDPLVDVGGVSGRYVRLQKSGTNPGGNYINIAEVQVFGYTGDGQDTTLSIDAQGKGNTTTTGIATQRDIAITLIGVRTTLKDLISGGNLILTPQ